MSVYVMPIAESHALSFRECLDVVAREQQFLALHEAPPPALVLAFVKENIASDNAQFVALDGDRVVGWADIVRGWAHAIAHTGTLGMGVLPDYRGQGIGESLLRACLDKARAKGITRVELMARVDNARAIRLYERLGFTREGIKRGAMRFGGVDYDCMMMGLVTDAP
jgi:ribosomal protein S18 acetylase RimI-like enzyme